MHASINNHSLSVIDWKITTASVYDKNITFTIIDSVGNYNYILMDAAYDSSNTYAISVIDTNRRRGIVEDRLTSNRKVGIAIRKKESSRYKLRWEIERAFSVLKQILEMEYIWYVKYRNYDIVIGEIIITYNCIVMANKVEGVLRRKII